MKAVIEDAHSPFMQHHCYSKDQSALSTTSSVLADLRSILIARFPESRTPCLETTNPAKETHGSGTSHCRHILPTGINNWDSTVGGLRMKEVTEICGTLGNTGLVMDRLLEATMKAGWLGAWVDAGDAMEVEDWDESALQRIVWVRCMDPMMALKATDLLLRDGNLSWVTLDLQSASPVALRRISAQHWHRFHRLVENCGNSLIVLTPMPMVEGAKVRVVGRQRLNLNSIHLSRRDLWNTKSVEVFVRGRHLKSIPESHTAPQPTVRNGPEIVRMTA